MMQRIIFLDIDGPIINTPMFFIRHDCSITRSAMNTQAIAFVVEIARVAKARIVTNSTHNTHDVDGKNLRFDLVEVGVPDELFHEQWRTKYPDYWGGHGRLRAIHDWMEENGEADWIAFDDASFTDSERLILVDFDRGIDWDCYQKARKYWRLPENRIIVA